MLAGSKLAKLLVRLFDRQIHAPEQHLPAWVGMQAGELGICADENVTPLALLHHLEKQTESFILITECGIGLARIIAPWEELLSPSNDALCLAFLPIRA